MTRRLNDTQITAVSILTVGVGTTIGAALLVAIDQWTARQGLGYILIVTTIYAALTIALHARDHRPRR